MADTPTSAAIPGANGGGAARALAASEEGIRCSRIVSRREDRYRQREQIRDHPLVERLAAEADEDECFRRMYMRRSR